MYDIIIAGAGGCGREVAELAQSAFSSEKYRIKGFLSDDLTVLDDFSDVRLPLLGTIVDHLVMPQERFLLAVGSPAGRRKIAECLEAKGAQFISLIHPTAQILPSAKIGKGTIVYPFVFVGSHACIEDFCLLNVASVCGHDAVVGRFSVLSPSAHVLGKAGLGEECFLAAHTTLAPKKSLGDRAVVSANSAALRNAKEDAFIMGVPGKNM